MPKLVMGPGQAGAYGLVDVHISDMIFNSTPVSLTSTEGVLTNGPFTYTLTGTGFSSSVPTAGTLEGVLVTNGGTTVFEMTNLNMSMAVLYQAGIAEDTNFDIAALENLFFGLGWTFVGNNTSELLPPSAVSSDGVPVNLTGKDKARLKGGDDIFAAGDGKDRVWGGDGDDFIYGQSGSDQLFGQADNDTLVGDKGNDLLDGGDGNDVLNGGKGQDTLIGGKGKDKLKGGKDFDALYGDGGNDVLDAGAGDDDMQGGAGKDKFIYRANYGGDLIFDFTDNVDTLKLDDAIWGGGLTVQQVLDTYADDTSGDTVFDFGGGNILTLFGVSTNRCFWTISRFSSTCFAGQVSSPALACRDGKAGDKMTTKIGVIGGSGVYEIAGLEDATWTEVDTPWGAPSDHILTGHLTGSGWHFCPGTGAATFSPPRPSTTEQTSTP